MRGQLQPRSNAGDIGKALFGLAAQAGIGSSAGFERVLCYEVADAARIAEAMQQQGSPRGPSSLQRLRGTEAKAEDTPELIPPDAVYAGLGGESMLVEPALAGRRAFMCCCGSATTCFQVLKEVVVRAAREMLSQSERIASERLLRLGLSALECTQDGQYLSWLDVLRDRVIDVSDSSGVSSPMPLRSEVVDALEDTLTKRAASAGGPRHYLLELSAGHANDVGVLTLVFVALPAGEDMPATAHSQTVLQDHLACMQQLSQVLGVCQQSSVDEEDSGGCPPKLLLLLAPRSATLTSQSLFSLVSAECFKLKEEQTEDAELELVAKTRLGASAYTQASSSALNPYKLDSPPDSDRISWGSGSPQSAGSSPGQLLPQGSAQGFATQSTAPSQSCRVMTPRSEGGLAEIPVHQWQTMAAMVDDFKIDAWQKGMQDHGKTSEDQVKELMGIVVQLQSYVGFLLQQVRGPVMPSGIASSRSTSAVMAPTEWLRWSGKGLTGHSGSLRVEGPGMGRSGSPRLAGGRQGQPVMRSGQPPFPQSLGAGSPRLPVGPEARSPGADDAISPLTRSRSANFPEGPCSIAGSTSMLNFTQKGGGSALNIHSETAVSPKMPHRDVSPTRPPSLMQVKGVIPKTASPPPPLHGQQQRNLVPYSFGPSFQSAAMPNFPPPVQVPGSSAVAAPMLSPRKEQRGMDDGARSPMPAPPGQPVPVSKAAQPHSARTNTGGPALLMQVPSRSVVGVGTAQGPAQGPGAENSNLRWEQPSPCRVRYMPGGKGSFPSPPTGGGPQNARSGILQPPSKAVSPNAPTVMPSSLAAQYGDVHRAGVYTSPTKVMRPSQ